MSYAIDRKEKSIQNNEIEYFGKMHDNYVKVKDSFAKEDHFELLKLEPYRNSPYDNSPYEIKYYNVTNKMDYNDYDYYSEYYDNDRINNFNKHLELIKWKNHIREAQKRQSRQSDSLSNIEVSIDMKQIPYLYKMTNFSFMCIF